MKGGPSCEIKVTCETAHPAEDLEGSDVEVGSLAAPRGDELIDFIAHASIVRQES